MPYPDDTFDAIMSMQVFEHVQDYDVALREIRRVLRPGCPSLHIFPPRYTPIEPHVYVPLGTVIQSRPWLRLWAALGMRNGFQQGKSAVEVMELNHRFLHEQTNYLPRRELMRRVRQVFPRAEFLTWHQLAAGGPGGPGSSVVGRGAFRRSRWRIASWAAERCYFGGRAEYSQ